MMQVLVVGHIKELIGSPGLLLSTSGPDLWEFPRPGGCGGTRALPVASVGTVKAKSWEKPLEAALMKFVHDHRDSVCLFCGNGQHTAVADSNQSDPK